MLGSIYGSSPICVLQMGEVGRGSKGSEGSERVNLAAPATRSQGELKLALQIIPPKITLNRVNICAIMLV
jgi:hypothetical protein